MARGHVGGDADGGHAAAARSSLRHRTATLLGGACLVLVLPACTGEETSTEPPDPGAPITRSPS